MTPSTLLHPLKFDVVGFQEDEHDYHFRVELPEPKCCQSCARCQQSPHFVKLRSCNASWANTQNRRLACQALNAACR